MAGDKTDAKTGKVENKIKKLYTIIRIINNNKKQYA